MKNKMIAAALFAAVFAFSASSAAFADGSGAPAHHHHHHWKQMKAVIQACAQANNIALPAKGSGEHLTATERSDLHACVQQFRQNVRSCVENAGVTRPAQGQKPDATAVAAFKQCRTQALSQITAK